MREIKGVELQDGRKVTVQEFSRGGSKSASLLLFIVDGRRVTPFEQRIRGPKLSLNGLFKVIYGDFFGDLVLPRFPLLEGSVLGEKYTVPVVLTERHGFTAVTTI